eukprot:SAG31_NODE_7641_length_1632_cov_3.556425_1_plen_90_part_10
MAGQHVEDLIADTSRLGIPIDFISTHFYPSDPNCTSTDPKSNHNGIRGDDPDCFSKILNKNSAVSGRAAPRRQKGSRLRSGRGRSRARRA